MAQPTVRNLLDSIRAQRLVDPGALAKMDDELATQYHEPRSLARELVRRQWLTDYQAEQLIEHEGQGLVLGPYLLLECLGQGGMGKVYKARHQLMNRLVAIKILRDELLAQDEVLQRFYREIQAVAQVSHPNIVLAHDADHIGSIHFLVMEYVEGTTLAKLIEAGPLPIGQACEYIRQAALGLQHAHEQGLVHRDIKPSNLLLTAKGSTVKILDLGLARLEQPELPPDSPQPVTRSGMVMGTADYMAPEQALDPRKVDARSDIYSLGCTLYHMLTGKPPYPGGTLTQKLLWHQNSEPKPPQRLRPAIPDDLAAVVLRMMARRPEDRYPTAAHVVEAVIPFSSVAGRRFLTVGKSAKLDPARADTGSKGTNPGTPKHAEPSDSAPYELVDADPGPARASRTALRRPEGPAPARAVPRGTRGETAPAGRERDRASRKRLSASHPAFAHDEHEPVEPERPEFEWRRLRGLMGVIIAALLLLILGALFFPVIASTIMALRAGKPKSEKP